MTGTLGGLAVALVVFLASHVIPSAPPVRRALVGTLGLAGYLLAYSVLSVGVLAWVVLAYAAAPYVEVWPPTEAARWFALLAMPVAFGLTVVGLSRPNPFSVGPGARGFDPEHPGLLRLTRHPALWGLVVWAGAHLPANGDAAGVMLFGSFLGLTLAGIPLVEAKRRRVLGDATWSALARNTAGMTSPRAWVSAVAEIGAGRLVLAGGLYAVGLWLHPYVLGAWPLPF